MECEDPIVAGGSQGLRLWLCPCCDAYGLEIGNLVLRLYGPDLRRLQETLGSLAARQLPERISLVLADGVNLLLTPRKIRGLDGILAAALPPRPLAAATTVH